MNYPQPATTDPYAFSLWPDASAASEEMMAWAQAAGYAQSGLTDNLFLDDLDTTLAWGQGGMIPTETYGDSVSIFAFGT